MTGFVCFVGESLPAVLPNALEISPDSAKICLPFSSLPEGYTEVNA